MKGVLEQTASYELVSLVKILAAVSAQLPNPTVRNTCLHCVFGNSISADFDAVTYLDRFVATDDGTLTLFMFVYQNHRTCRK